MGESSAGTGDKLLHFLLCLPQGLPQARVLWQRQGSSENRDCLILCALRPYKTSTRRLFRCFPRSLPLPPPVPLSNCNNVVSSIHQDSPGPPTFCLCMKYPDSKHPPALRALLISHPHPTDQGCLLWACCLGHLPASSWDTLLLVYHLLFKALGAPSVLSPARTRKQLSVQGKSSLTQFPQAIC